MRHQRLGDIPKSKKWQAVVAVVAGEGRQEPGLLVDAVTEVADQTLQATEAGLERAIHDRGLCHTFFLLTQIVLAAREKEWRDELRRLGIHLEDDSSLFELTSQLQQSIDDYLDEYPPHTDVSEMAQQAAIEAIGALAGPSTARVRRGILQNDLRRLRSLFGIKPTTNEPDLWKSTSSSTRKTSPRSSRPPSSGWSNVSTWGTTTARRKARNATNGFSTRGPRPRRNLIDFFGPNKLVQKITPADAERWRIWLGQQRNARD